VSHVSAGGPTRRGSGVPGPTNRTAWPRLSRRSVYPPCSNLCSGHRTAVRASLEIGHVAGGQLSGLVEGDNRDGGAREGDGGAVPGQAHRTPLTRQPVERRGARGMRTRRARVVAAGAAVGTLLLAEPWWRRSGCSP
jgi:hypothetical protein